MRRGEKFGESEVVEREVDLSTTSPFNDFSAFKKIPH
jgi:hypothetical protein